MLRLIADTPLGRVEILDPALCEQAAKYLTQIATYAGQSLPREAEGAARSGVAAPPARLPARM